MALIEKDIPKIKEWLLTQGAEVLPETNDYELLRYKGDKVGVIYSTGNVSSEHVRDMLKAFRTKSKWKDAPKSTGRNSNYKRHKLSILNRDGCNCFYCGRELGEDITLEHLIPLTSGGTNLLSNMVLAHEICNHKMGAKPLNEKVQFAITNRYK